MNNLKVTLKRLLIGITNVTDFVRTYNLKPGYLEDVANKIIDISYSLNKNEKGFSME